MRRILSLAAAVALLGGCDLGPDYKPPALEVPAAYRASADTMAPAWPARDWWRGFGSPELDGLIAAAEQGNFDIQAAIARVAEADAQLIIAGAPLLPTVGATGQASWQRASLGNGTSRSLHNSSRYYETRTYNAGLNASYELDFWGSVRAGRDAAAAQALFSRYDQQTVALTAVASVATTWFQALAAQDRLDVLARNLHDSEQILDAIRGRLDAGTASALDVAQQEALVAGLRAQAPALRSSRDQYLIGLGILIGRPPEAITVQAGTLNTLRLPEVAPGLPSALLARRPDVAAAEAQLVAANADIRQARANFFPQIQLTGQGGWQSATLNTLFGPGAVLLSAAASATQTVFDNGLKQGQYAQNKARYDELLADYRKSVVQAFTDVDNGLTAYRDATEQETLQRRAVDVAQRAADIARAQLLAGTSDIVTALQAQTTLFSDLDLLAQIRLSRFLALVNLYQALGGGWSQADVAPPRTPILQGVL